VSLLNAALLGCAPKDPPPPRRSKRSVVDEDQNEPPTPKNKQEASSRIKRKSKSLISDDDTRVVTVEPILELPTQYDGTTNEQPPDAKQRKRLARNVGGWISPEFSKEIERSWLERDTPAEKFDLSTYVPQVGDTVL
jgi:hypothetical protein